MRLEIGPGDWDLRGGTEEEKEKEETFLLCESIGLPCFPFNFKPNLLRQGTAHWKLRPADPSLPSF